MSLENIKNQEQSRSSDNKRKYFFIILILILAGVNIFLWVKNSQIRHQKEELKVKYSQADSLRDVFKAKWNAAVAQLEEYEGINAEMDSTIEALKEELMEERHKFEDLLAQKNISDAVLNRAKQKINELSRMMNSYVAQVDSLSNENKALRLEKETLEQRLNVEKDYTQTLQGEKRQLEQKVELASVFRTKNIKGTGVRYKSNGEEAETDNYKKTDKIKVCFELHENKVIDPGEQTILMKVIGPDGAVFYSENYGSGVFTSRESGEQEKYTKKASFQYPDEKVQNGLCIYWDQNIDFPQGEYRAELYHKGYRIGTDQFELKWSLF